MAQGSYPVVDPLTSADGTTVKVQTTKTEGLVKTVDESVLEQLTDIASSLRSIRFLLEMEFEQTTEDLDHV